MLFLTGCAKDLIISNMPNSNLNYHGDNVPITIIAYKLRDVAKFKALTEQKSPIKAILSGVVKRIGA